MIITCQNDSHHCQKQLSGNPRLGSTTRNNPKQNNEPETTHHQPHKQDSTKNRKIRTVTALGSTPSCTENLLHKHDQTNHRNRIPPYSQPQTEPRGPTEDSKQLPQNDHLDRYPWITKTQPWNTPTTLHTELLGTVQNQGTQAIWRLWAPTTPVWGPRSHLNMNTKRKSTKRKTPVS